MISSSTQAAFDNPYGQSKKAGEDLMYRYGKETGAVDLVKIIFLQIQKVNSIPILREKYFPLLME